MKRSILFIILLFTLLQSCEKPCCVKTYYALTVYNNSSKSIIVSYSGNYPDTLLNQQKPFLFEVNANDKVDIKSKDPWEEEIQNDTIMIFVISRKTYNEYSWDEIYSDYKILKRYDISLEDLENSNWTVNYP